MDDPVSLMEDAPCDTSCTPKIWDKYKDILHRHEPEHSGIQMVERFAIYEKAKDASLIIATGETAIYANILLQKGVVQA